MAATPLQLGQIKNLLNVAFVDGKIEESELSLIAAVASREKLSEEQLESLLDNPDSVEIEIPEDEETRQEYLTDMIALMLIDGEISESELQMCKLYAIRLGYPSSIVDEMLNDIITDLSEQ